MENNGEIVDVSTSEAEEDWKSKLSTLQNEKKKMQDEFNMQRAKMKELFLQKEAECKKLTKEMDTITKEMNEVKSQILVAEYSRESEIQNQDRRAQEEIASLQQLVHETIEESSYSKSEIERLLDEIEKLRDENSKLVSELNHSHSLDSSLAPVLNQVKKTIARKLGADSSSNDYLEDSMRKVNKYAQEDAEVLRSLVVPLEEEIKALKEKLRTTDEELQTFRATPTLSSSHHTTTTDSALVGLLNEQQQRLMPSDGSEANNPSLHPESPQLRTCSTCQGNQLQLEQSQAEVAEQKRTGALLRKDIERFKEELEREAVLRRDLEEQWQEKREAHKRDVQTLGDTVNAAERDLRALQLHYADAKEDIKQELLKLTSEREAVHRHLETLQSDNDYLAGKYLATSEELQNQRIDLPNNVEDLQEFLLKCHENLIEARVGCEFEQRKSMSYFDEAQLLRDQLTMQQSERHLFERDVGHKIRSLESQVKQLEVEQEKLVGLKDTFESKEIDLEKQASDLRVQVIELRDNNEKFEKLNGTLKQKLSVLQQELGNSEAVQKDFVRLSQSLQMELEKIRAADTSVRWQDDEDVDQCPSCKSQFAVTRRKQHCRHCGTIYCEKCLTKSVPSGQRKKPARVCDVCHTLLERNTAPYFSQAPPQSPT